MRVTTLLSLAPLLVPGLAQLNPGYNVDTVRDRMLDLSHKSWEQGTAAQALLELADPQHSIFGARAFDQAPDSTWALSYARGILDQHLGSDQLTGGDGSAGDPASLGVFATMLGGVYREAAKRQYEDLTQRTPRFWNDAISHRKGVAELWADFVYMAPPFMAYYGAAVGDEGAVREAVKQCEKYREVLGGGGVWRHIEGPQSRDEGKWSTGNAWAAAGMARVLATLQRTSVGSGWGQEQADLKNWIKEILDGVMRSDKDGGLLRNYFDFPNDRPVFGEVSGTALLAATAYRMHTIDEGMFGDDYVKFADEARAEIGRRVNPDGIVSPAIDPMDWRNWNPVTTGSPEGNSFTVLLFTAWRDCVEAGKCSQASSRVETLGRRSWLSWVQRKD